MKYQYATIDKDNPEALGVCDRSGMIFNHKDLVKQMEWRGDALVWTGMLVGPPFVDKPCEQNRPPVTKNDPVPIKNPRPSDPYMDPEMYPVTWFSQTAIKEKFQDESFYDDKAPPFNPPQYVEAGSSIPGYPPIPGWHDPDPLPSNAERDKILKKVWFQ